MYFPEWQLSFWNKYVQNKNKNPKVQRLVQRHCDFVWRQSVFQKRSFLFEPDRRIYTEPFKEAWSHKFRPRQKSTRAWPVSANGQRQRPSVVDRILPRYNIPDSDDNVDAAVIIFCFEKKNQTDVIKLHFLDLVSFMKIIIVTC